MIKQELTTAFRSILRKKVISIISILGLGIGLGCIIVLLALVIHEKSFDTFIPDHRNVYRIISATNSQVHFPLAESMKNDFPVHSTIQPMVILPQNPSRMGLLAIRTDGVNVEKIIKLYRDLYSQISPD